MEMKLEWVPIEQKDVIHHLMQFYLYDFTEFLDIELEETGKFETYPDLDTFWEQGEGKFAILISFYNKPAGFALVERLDHSLEADYYMTEFFIMKKYRRSGLGSWAAKELFQHYKGKWKVTQLRNNRPAQKFWQKVIGDYTGEEYVEKVLADSGNVSQYFKS